MLVEWQYLKGMLMFKQKKRSVVLRTFVLLALMVVPVLACILPTQQAFADEAKKPDGLEVLVNGQPYKDYDISKG